MNDIKSASGAKANFPAEGKPPPADGGASPSEPSAGEVESFGRLVSGKKATGGDGKTPGGESPKDMKDLLKEKGSGGLSDLFGQAARGLTDGAANPAALQGNVNVPLPVANEAVQTSQAGATAAPGSADALASARCGELVERILVSQPASGGAQEVRLKLDQAWLPDTEVRLVRADAGLTIEFASDNVDAQRFLLPNLSTLRERLLASLDGAVTIRMSESTEADGDTRDGRSRNRRNLYEETKDNVG